MTTIPNPDNHGPASITSVTIVNHTLTHIPNPDYATDMNTIKKNGSLFTINSPQSTTGSPCKPKDPSDVTITMTPRKLADYITVIGY